MYRQLCQLSLSGVLMIAAMTSGVHGEVIIQDDFESYTSSQNIAPKPSDSATLSPAAPTISPGGAAYEYSVSTNQWVHAIAGNGGQVAGFRGDSFHGLAITTGSHAGSITGYSADLANLDYIESFSGIGGGFWSASPAGTRLANIENFTGFIFNPTNVYLYDGGTLDQTVAHGKTLSEGAYYNLSFDINPDGTFGNLSFAGTDYTLQFAANNTTGLFDEDATRYAGGLAVGGGNARYAMDNFMVQATVPEPASLGLLVMGAALLLPVRRTR